MKIIIDAMGGDNAPNAPVLGGIAANRDLGLDIALVGRTEEILRVLEENGVQNLPKGVEIVNATQVIEMCDNPANAFREKKDSSLTVGLTMVKKGEGDAFVSAGSTGAILSAATLVTKRIKGIRRAALAPLVPTAGGGAILLDCGANAVCPPEYLLQFAYMGAYYAEMVLGRKNPRVGLLNIGTEPTKGTDLQLETYPLLMAAKEAGRLNFVGNVEAKEAMMGEVDVIVSDGYSGNIMLKTMEGTGKFVTVELKKMFKKNPFTMLAALAVSGGMKDLKKMMSADEVGGTALLGISKPVIKAHGSSGEMAIHNACRQAKQYVNAGVVENITENIHLMRVERETPSEKNAESKK